MSIGSQLVDNEAIEFGKKHGKVWTLIADGHVICVGGVLLKREGVGELWSIPSQYIKQYPIFYIKAVRRIIGDAKTRHQLRRLQTLTRLDDVISYNLHKHLGFKFEGVMEKYFSDSSDAIRGAMTWDL